MNKNKKLLTTLAFVTTALATIGVGATVNADDKAIVSAQDTVAVSVTVGVEVTTYADFASALQYANGYESAKITLVGDIVDGADAPTIQTNLTLDIAGKEMNNAYFGFPSNPSKPSSLLIEDSSGDNTGRLLPKSGLAISQLRSGSVTINGGTFIQAGIYVENEDSVLTINGGVFEKYLSVSTKMGMTIVNGGVFEDGLFYLDGGEVFVKGGLYKSLDIRNGVFADVLADGYALKNSAGEYQDIYSNRIIDAVWDSENEQYIYRDEYTVEEHSCENGSQDYQYDENEHWFACECFRKIDGTNDSHTIEFEHDRNYHLGKCYCGFADDKEAHTGGEATCMERAVCDICKESYGDEPLGHILGEDGNCVGCGEEIVFMTEVYGDTKYYLEMPALWDFKHGSGKLLADITVSGELNTGSGGEPTLDLNGYTIRVSEEATVANSLFVTASGDSSLKIIDTSEAKAGAIDYDGIIFGGQGYTQVESCNFPSGIRVKDMCIADIVADGSCFGEAVVAEDATEYTTAITVAKHAHKMQTNETQHWFVCACGEEKLKEEHADYDNDGECDFCDIKISTQDETSDTETSDTETSDTETSDTETSDTETSDTETSDTETSDTETSDTETSDTTTSDTTTSDNADNKNEGAEGKEPEEADEGCGGSVASTMAGVFSVLGVAVLAVVIRRRKTSS